MANPETQNVFATAKGVFTPQELDRLEQYCDGLPVIRSSVSGPDGAYFSDVLRVARIASLPQAPDIMWFYERLAGVVRTFNERSFRFDLRGFSEPPQFMAYHGSEGGHFDWHMDTGSLPPRKLSMTLQLSEASAYEGCDLQINTGTVVFPAPRDRGTAIAFASHTIHRVTPITSGTRKAIVAWITGPEFK